MSSSVLDRASKRRGSLRGEVQGKQSIKFSSNRDILFFSEGRGRMVIGFGESDSFGKMIAFEVYRGEIILFLCHFFIV